MFISNRPRAANAPTATLAVDALEAAITAVHPAELIPKAVRIERNTLLVLGWQFPLPERGVTVIGGGKASGAMAQAFEQIVGPWRIRTGVVATAPGDWSTPRIRQIVAGHPTPDGASRMAVREMRRLLHGLNANDLVVCLLSGGGSAMLTEPPPGASTRDMVRLTQLLLASGAPIDEINIVRRHLSQSAGGKLARAVYPAQVLTLAISDVLDGPPEAIASGPTLPDPTTFADALAVLDRYQLRKRTPPSLRVYLEQGVAGQQPENPKPGDPLFDRCSFHVIGSSSEAVFFVEQSLRASIPDVRVVGNHLRGEAQAAARSLGALIRDAARDVPEGGRALVWGGEFTVTLGKAHGEGGRCQEFLAALIPEIAGLDCAVAMIGTDGVDFVPGVGGAVITGATAAHASTLGLDIYAALRDHSSTALHRALGTLIEMRPTGTNVCDIGVCVFAPISDGPVTF